MRLPAPRTAGGRRAARQWPGPSQQRPQQYGAVGRTEDGLRRPFGMRHQPDDVAAFIADSGDVVEASIGILDVAQDDLVVLPQLLERALVTDEVALEVVDRYSQDLAGLGGAGQNRRGGLDAELDGLAAELETGVLLQCPGQ